MRLALLLTLAVATPVAGQKPQKPDSFDLRVYRGVAMSDSEIVSNLAKRQSPRPNSARITRLVFRGDTAEVTVFTETIEQRLRFARHDGKWALLPEPQRTRSRHEPKVNQCATRGDVVSAGVT